jgi:hypothetical protein
VADLLAFLLPLAAADAAEEGKKVITGMLVVGLIFATIVVGGELIHWWRHLRRRPR